MDPELATPPQIGGWRRWPRQHGVVGRKQLHALGLGDGAIAKRAGRGGCIASIAACTRSARVLSEHRAGTTRTQSELEERFLEMCDAHGLPRPEVNAVVAGYEVDFVWRNARLIVETDGHAAQGTRRAFERDRLRDLELTAAGWRVVRLTYARLSREPAAVAAQLAKLR
jgi:very-short-patch-repair endonuclease